MSEFAFRPSKKICEGEQFENYTLYLTNSYCCDKLFLLLIRSFKRVGQIGHRKPEIRFEDAPRRPKKAKTSCAKYASRGTKLECPLESVKFLEL